MSAIAIPLPSRQASRARTDEPVAGPASGRGGGQSSRRPRLRLVTEDFVPEAPVRSGLEGAPRPVSASVGVAALPAAPAMPAMRRPAAPVALRGRRTELERLAPQHPAVRAAGLRRSAQQEEDRRGDAQSVSKSESVPSRPRKTVKAAVRSRAGLRLLRGGLAVIVAAGAEWAFGWARADAIASLLIAVLMAPRALTLLRRSLAILMEQAPASVDVTKLRAHMMGVDGVLGVHDLHVVAVSSHLVTVTAHVTVTHEADGPSRDRIVHELGECACHHFPIAHSTFQLECPQHREHEHIEH